MMRPFDPYGLWDGYLFPGRVPFDGLGHDDLPPEFRRENRDIAVPRQ